MRTKKNAVMHEPATQGQPQETRLEPLAWHGKKCQRSILQAAFGRQAVCRQMRDLSLTQLSERYFRQHVI